MSATALLIARLRTLGVSLRSDGTRLLVEAPLGVLDSGLRDRIKHQKIEILSLLEAKPLKADTFEEEAVRNIAALLAIAYRRSCSVPPLGEAQGRESNVAELANSGGVSVHGVVA